MYTPSINELVMSTAPGTSAPAFSPSPWSGSSSRWARIAVISPIGRLMKKIQCQLIACVRMPPSSRPIEPPADATNAKTPIAFA